jgi:hypothetical protein
MGEKPSEEAHHEPMSEEMPVGEAIETPAEATEGIEEAVGNLPSGEAALESAEAETAATDVGMPPSATTEKEIAMSSEDAEDEECEECGEDDGDDDGDKPKGHTNKDHDKEEEHEEHESEEHEHDEHEHDDKKDEPADHDHAHDSKPDFLKKTGDEDEGEDTEQAKKEASVAQVFRKGKISSTGEINLDLSNVLQVLANQGKQIKQAKK